ncbi:MAG: TonB-dependent receptor [Thermodesulfobacteria bacterium]|nr:TonB-dependent receptor [Thermodesulfobacteriota bacterium]
MKKLGIVSLAVMLGTVSVAKAITTNNSTTLNEVVVTATRVKEPLKSVTSVVDVVNSKKISQENPVFLVNVLREVPSIFITQNGVGGTANLSIRGTGNGRTLVMIDGVPVYDVISTSEGDFSFFLPLLDTTGIGKIEVVEGPVSVLYGSGAMGGVVNLIPKTIKTSGAEVKAEIGSYSTFKEGATVKEVSSKGSSFVSVSKTDIQGFSKTYSEPDKDPYHNLNLAGKIVYTPSLKHQISLTSFYLTNYQNLDGWDKETSGSFGFFDLVDNYQVNKMWKTVTKVAYSSTIRSYDNGGGSVYKGRLWYMSLQNDLKLTKNFTTILGIDYKLERGETNGTDESAYQKSLYGEGILKLDKAVINGGIRYTKHKTAGSKVLYNLGVAVFPLEGIKVHSTLGTSFRAPSIYQLYSSYGNKTLSPEKGFGADLGVTFYNSKASFDVTGFYNKIKDEIGFNMTTWKYVNSGSFKVLGVEARATYEFEKGLKGYTYYTYIYRKNLDTNKIDKTFPKYKVGIGLSYSFLNKGDFWINGVYVDKYFDSSNHKLGNFLVVNTGVDYALTSNITLFGKVNNLFDKKYEEIYDYQMPRFSIYAGVKVKF